jgi:glycosyltransferase involved in cell wall biosynthesis
MLHENMSKRVVFFHIASDCYGGGSQMLYRLLSSIEKQSIDPILLSQKEDTLSKKVRQEQIPVQIVPFRGSLDAYNQTLLTGPTHLKVRAVPRLLQFNAEIQDLIHSTDVLWCQNLRALLSVAPYSILSDVYLIWNIGLGKPSEGIMKYLNTLAICLADQILIESRIQAERIFTESQLQHADNDLTVINKGIDINRFPSDSTNDTEPFRVGMAALLTPRKRVEDFIRTAEFVQDEKLDMQFVVAGSPPDNNHTEYIMQMHKLVKSKNLDDVVEFIGWVDDMPKFLNSLDVFVLPSLNEGIPGVIKEAMATETPVVATNVGGVPEIIDHETNGYLIEPRSPSQIADRIRELYGDPELRDQMGKNGRQQIIDNYSIETYVNQYKRILMNS